MQENMEDVDFLVNCSVQDNFKNNLTDTIELVVIESGLTPIRRASSDILSILTIAIFFDVLLSLEFSKHGTSRLKSKLVEIFNAKALSRTLVLTSVVFVLPLIPVFFMLALLYKVSCSIIIKRKDNNFVGFLDSFDVFWCLEDDSAKSIINVLGVIESDSPVAIANDIKEKLLNIFTHDGTKKIFYRRNEKYGFYYWRKYNAIDINEYVEIVELPDKENLDETDLENLMTDVQQQSLPYNDEGLFKIIITKQRVGNYENERGDYGIIFRIHHAVGDGVALIEFLCRTLADKAENCPVNMFSFPEPKGRDSPYAILDMMHRLCEMPVCFADCILRKPDESTLHGPTLLGKKVFKWTETDDNLLALVKEIKDNVEHLNFNDVLMTSLSSGLRHFFTETVAPIPEDVAVILPVRFPKTSPGENNLLLANDFSVTILDLPVNEKNMREVKNRCNALRKSADPLTNYYFLKLVPSVLPRWMSQPLLHSSQATMVFSNMPGPESLNICGGNALKKLVFFVPHKGTTGMYENLMELTIGLGVTALCYGGVLRLAAMADAALTPRPEDLSLILDGMVEEIRYLHRQYVTQ